MTESTLRADAPIFVPFSGVSSSEESSKVKGNQTKRSYRRNKQRHSGRRKTNTDRNPTNPCKQIQEQDTMATIEQGSTSILEEVFPRLIDLSSKRKHESKEGVWEQGVTELKLKLQQAPPPETNNDDLVQYDENDDVKGMVILGTISNGTLTRPSMEQNSTETLGIEAEAYLEAGKNAHRRRRDISHLRNRWWKIVQARPSFVPTTRENDSLSTSASSNNSTDDETLSLVDTSRPMQFVEPSEPINTGNITTLEQAVYQDRPDVLRHLLTAAQVKNNREDYSTMALQAIRLRHEECLEALLLSCGSSILLTSSGNNALHVYCLCGGSHSTLELLFKTAGRTLLPKLFTSKNERGQTALHIACTNYQLHVVEYFLAHVSAALLSKTLALTDDEQRTPLLAAIESGSLDIVMTLIMWRGNNHIDTIQLSPVSPLEWAVIRTQNLEMISLLLEFNDPKGESYPLTPILHAALSLKEGCNIDIVRILVENGANPCATVDVTGKEATSGLIRVARKHDAATLSILLKVYLSFLDEQRQSRRKDPILAKQPESFFAGMESREDAEKSSAMRDALITSLYLGWTASEDSSGYFECAIILFQLGAKLGNIGLERLRESMAIGSLSCSLCRESPLEAKYYYRTSYEHPAPTKRRAKSNDRMHWSKTMVHCLDTFIDAAQCPWLLSLSGRSSVSSKVSLPPTDIVIITEDGESFHCHKSILMQKSDKLAAAIRFLSRTDVARSGLPELYLEISSRMCSLLLLHIYHGSVANGLARDCQTCSDELLDLMLIAEQFLCLSLLNETTQRLLSSYPQQCFCLWCSTQMNEKADGSTTVFCVSAGPSSFVTASNALDILAVAQQIQDSGVELKPTLEVSLDACWKTVVNLKPSECLRFEAVSTILQHFDFVVNNSSFHEQIKRYHDIEHAQRLLLHMCMEELADVPFPASYSRKTASFQRQRIRKGSSSAITNKVNVQL